MSSNSSFHERVLLNIERLNILTDLALLNEKFETIYDRLTHFASELIGAPVSLVSMVADDYQYFKSHVGLPEPWKSRRRTPLSHSFCQHVVVNKKPLIVEDAREVDFLKDNLAIPDLNVIGYLGVPLTLSNNTSLGSFCVIDGEPRKWTEVEVDIMHELAGVLIYEFEMRAKVNLKKASNDDLAEVHGNIDKLISSIDRKASQVAILAEIKAARQEFELV